MMVLWGQGLHRAARCQGIPSRFSKLESYEESRCFHCQHVFAANAVEAARGGYAFPPSPLFIVGTVTSHRIGSDPLKRLKAPDTFPLLCSLLLLCSCQVYDVCALVDVQCR